MSITMMSERVAELMVGRDRPLEARMTATPRSGCALNATVQVVADRRALLVLSDLMVGDRRCSWQLPAGAGEGVASTILSDRPKRLTARGLLTCAQAKGGRRANCCLTAACIQVPPILVVFGSGGLARREGDRRLRGRAELLRDAVPELVEATMHERRERRLGRPLPPGTSRVSARPDAAHGRMVGADARS